MTGQRVARKGLGGAIKQRSESGGRRDGLGAGSDFQALCTVDALVAHAARLASARQGDDVRDRERSALVSYFRDIAAIPTLTKDHEVLLAKEIEASTGAFREGMRSIPLTARDSGYGGMVTPDRISIFREPILAMCHDEDQVVHHVRVTVVHEIAHHFGIDDKRLHELGWG